MSRTPGSKNKIVSHPSAFTTARVDPIGWRIFCDYAKFRGLNPTRALEMAMSEFVQGGCDSAFSKFRAVKPHTDGMAKALRGMMKAGAK